MQPSCKKKPVSMRERLQEQLRKAGLRRTKAREWILSTLLEANRPLTHQQISEELIACGLDKVTVYRTLNTLNEAGLVHAVQGIGGTLLFCGNPDNSVRCPGDHPHFQCRRCGVMQCIGAQELPRIIMTAGAQVETKQLVAFGLCPVCARSCGRRRRSSASSQDQLLRNHRKDSHVKG